MMDKSSNTEPFINGGGVNANFDVLGGDKPDYVRAMLKITNCIVQGRYHEGVYYPVEGPESASDETDSEEELPTTMLPQQTSSLSSSSSSSPQSQSQLQESALQFHSVAFKAQQHKQHLQQLQQQQQQLLQQQQQQQLQQKEQSSPATICPTVLEQSSSIVSKKLKKSETVQDFAEKYWRETQKLNRVFEDEDCFLVSNHKSSKNLSNLGGFIPTPARRHHSRTEHKNESDEPKGITLYLQPINHDLTFKTNSTIDKSTQI